MNRFPRGLLIQKFKNKRNLLIVSGHVTLAILTRIEMLKFKCQEAKKGVEIDSKNCLDTIKHQVILGLVTALL